MMSEDQWVEGLPEWEERWNEGRTGFHRSDVNDKLLRHASALMVGEPSRVLVPLCGKSVDLLWFESQGLSVVGVELVSKAIASFFEESGREVRQHDVEGAVAHTSGEITVFESDFLSLSSRQVGAVDVMYDRAALVAVTPDVRARYVAQQLELLRPGGRLLLVTYDLPVEPTKGPPFRVPIDTVAELYRNASSVELLETIDNTPETEPRLADRGVPWSQEGVFLIQR